MCDTDVAVIVLPNNHPEVVKAYTVIDKSNYYYAHTHRTCSGWIHMFVRKNLLCKERHKNTIGIVASDGWEPEKDDTQ